MNKSMLIGVVAGIGVAAAGGVTAFALFGQSSELDATGSAAGAAAGGFFGRRAQRNRQENNTETVIERRCAPIGTR
jgi:uncharacterized protein YcfJ